MRPHSAGGLAGLDEGCQGGVSLPKGSILHQGRFKLDISKNAFTRRAVVESPSLEGFESRVDPVLSDVV